MKRADRLQAFRRQVERQTRQPAHEVELPLAHVLSDVCKALGLSKADTRRVVGRRGVRHLETDRQWCVSIRRGADEK